MNTAPITMAVLDDMVRRIVEGFNPTRIILLGSYAKGDATIDSDIDLLIVTPVEFSCRKKANEIDLALADRTVPLDLIVVTPEQFAQNQNVLGSIVREAALEGRVIYERAA